MVISYSHKIDKYKLDSQRDKKHWQKEVSEKNVSRKWIQPLIHWDRTDLMTSIDFCKKQTKWSIASRWTYLTNSRFLSVQTLTVSLPAAKRTVWKALL